MRLEAIEEEDSSRKGITLEVRRGQFLQPHGLYKVAARDTIILPCSWSLISEDQE